MNKRNSHLLLSAITIISVALLYGISPHTTLPFLFDFKVESLALKNIFRATMGLYLVFAFFWIYGALQLRYWKSATMLNILFMGGLALGRLLSFVLDGIQYQYMFGMFVEVFFMLWGIHNLYENRKK